MAANLPIFRYEKGDVAGYCTVLDLVFEASHYSKRLYAVQLNCCGLLLEKSQKQLRDGQRRNRASCPECAGRKRLANRETTLRGKPITIGEKIGPVTVIGVGHDNQHKLVKWACCGNEEQLAHRRIFHLRNEAKHELNYQKRCWSCYSLARSGKASERAKKIVIEEAMLPLGIISAATAWPRPRLGAVL